MNEQQKSIAQEMAEVAFQSDCELVNASWSLDSGRTVEMRICGHAYDRVHPFKRFTLRRNGRVGTRFTATIAHRTGDGIDPELVYHSDAMLKSWSEGSGGGQTFVLWLDDEADRHPFAGYERRKYGSPGELFYVILVELHDDETAVDQSGRARAERGNTEPRGVRESDNGPPSKAFPARPARGPRKPSAAAHLIVTHPMFVRYLTETRAGLVKKWTPELARKYVKSILKLESLSELDRNADAARRFEEEIRRPYNRWSTQEP